MTYEKKQKIMNTTTDTQPEFDFMAPAQLTFDWANKDTYLDGSKVTSNLRKVTDKSNRNNFALA